MLGSNDKVTFTVINIRDNEGVLINKIYKLPLEEEVILPNNIERVSIFEGHSGMIDQGFVAFDIIVGKRSKIKDLTSENKRMFITCDLNFKSVNDECVYRETENGFEIFSHVNQNDLVVSSVDSLIKTLKFVSAQVSTIKTTCNKVKELRK
ncbi:MAG: hypothetical protein K6E99_00225 [Bacilli bacterium]|nr:hypothetical protein [Bacilli bacterium]